MLRNETKSEPLRLALDDVTCILEETNDVNKEKPILEIVANDESQNDEYTDTNVIKEATVQPIESQVSIVDMPAEALPCPSELTQNSEDSLMLSSKVEGFWGQSSSVKVTIDLSVFLLCILVVRH